jgi:lipopolysaccharide export system protein LptA
MLLMLLVAGSAPSRGEIVPPSCPEAQKICLQADRDGGIDIKSGTAYMEGNVVGVLKQHDLRFRSELLRAFRNERGEWTRLELDQGVELEQPTRRATGDHARIENDTGVADLHGSVTLSEPFTYAEGVQLHLERTPPRSVLTGNLQHRAFLRHEGRVPVSDAGAFYSPDRPEAPPGTEAQVGDPEPGAEPSPGGAALPEPPAGAPEDEAQSPDFTRRGETPAPSAGEGGPQHPPAAPEEPGVLPAFLPDTVLVIADEAIYERDLRQAHFSGDVFMQRREMGWKVWAQQVDLEFSEDQRLVRLDAAGNVRIEQPGRVLVAAEVHSQDEMDVLLLSGNARAQQAGQFDLASDRIEVFTSVEKGLVQSEDRQRPIRLTLDVGPSPPYQLTETSLETLRAQGLPELTLAKLAELRDRSFPNRSGFVEALRGLISRQEAELYQATIAEAARTGPRP